jgi:asparagine synthase (glutamine-hydrolysing)
MGRELGPFVEEVFASASFRSRPYWDAEAVAADFARFRAGKAPYSWEVFRIFVTELWLRLFFDDVPEQR